MEGTTYYNPIVIEEDDLNGIGTIENPIYIEDDYDEDTSSDSDTESDLGVNFDLELYSEMCSEMTPERSPEMENCCNYKTIIENCDSFDFNSELFELEME